MAVLICIVCGRGFAWAEDSPDLLNVIEARWGFDTTVQRDAFLPLSIHVQNISDRPWAGSLSVLETSASSHQYFADVSLQPNENRWVQIVVYLEDELTEWEVRWGPLERHRFQLTNKSYGPMPTVLLYDTDAVDTTDGVLRRTPEYLFPTSVTATHSLRGVIFNHVPFWQGARARAFREWLMLGGRVYLMHDDTGRYPQFHKELEFLNQPADRFEFGRGIVTRIPLAADEINLTQARQLLFNDDWRTTPRNGIAPANNVANMSWNRHGELYHDLIPLARFQRKWWLIYLTVAAYLLAIYPGCYHIGCRLKNVSRFYIAFLGAAGLFSVIFVLLGQIGGSLDNRFRSVNVARYIENGGFDVSGWGVVANVHEGTYGLELPGTGQSLRPGRGLENETSELNAEGRLTLNLPPAATQTLLYQYRVNLDVKEPRLQRGASNEMSLNDLAVEVKGCFAEPVQQAFAIQRGGIYALKQVGTQLVLDPKIRRGTLLHELTRSVTWNERNTGFFRIRNYYRSDDETSEQIRYERMLRYLVGNSFNLHDRITSRELNLPNDVLRLAVFTETPNELLPTASDFPNMTGGTLFVYDLHMPN